MNPLKVIETGEAYPMCQYDHQLLTTIAEGVKANTEATKENSDAVKTLVSLYREGFRWLLIVVCVIALGNKAVDLAKDLWGSHSAQAEAR